LGWLYKNQFFFTERTRTGVIDLEIDDKIKKEFKKANATGKLIPLILDIDKKGS
jgi:hypothetical protein